MGYDISLIGKDGIVQIPRHNAGSILQFDLRGKAGTVDAEISVTWNYNKVYHEVVNMTLRQMLSGKRGKRTIPILTKVVKVCGTACDEDYWKATPGNAGTIASLLLSWAILHPDAKWEVI